MYQRVEIIGNLGGDPEMRYMPDGTAVTNFSVATNRKWTDKNTNELVEEVTWFRVAVWGKQAEACNQYLAKGRQVFVAGRIKTDPKTGSPKIWTREDGTASATLEIQAQVVQFLGAKDSVEGGGSGGDSGGPRPGTAAAVEEDEIPF